jgi:hypothetical protein
VSLVFELESTLFDPLLLGLIKKRRAGVRRAGVFLVVARRPPPRRVFLAWSINNDRNALPATRVTSGERAALPPNGARGLRKGPICAYPRLKPLCSV